MTSWDGPDTPDTNPLESGPSSIDQRIHVTGTSCTKKDATQQLNAFLYMLSAE